MCSSAWNSQHGIRSGRCQPNLLYDSAPIHLERQSQDMISHLICEDLLLGLIAMFKELLYHIVTEHISHELYGVRMDLSEHLIFLIAVGGL